MKFDPEVLREVENTISWRRRLHQHPELSFHERQTTAMIQETLLSFDGITVFTPTQTGVIGEITGNRSGAPLTVGIRADIDALPIQEAADLPFRSEVPNVMHACGHDGHTAILLTLAKLLSENRDAFCGRVRLIFQHAEELPPGGAIELVKAGAAENVDWMLGLHLSTNWPTGVFGVRSGALTAAVDSFRIQIRGKGGHCAFPEQCIDPVVTACQTVLALQTIVARKIAATDAAVVSVCEIHGGSAYNIIPGEATLSGAVRSFSGETRDLVETEVRRIAAHTAYAAGAEAEVEYRRGYPSVVNDPALTKRCAEILRKRFGRTNVEPIDRIMPGEDFAYFTAHCPGFFVELGTKNEEKQCAYPHHNSLYRLDENALQYGVQYYFDAVRSLLDGRERRATEKPAACV
jgi:amidohydrolase